MVVAFSVNVTYYSVIMHRPSEPVNPTASAVVGDRSSGIRTKIWQAVQAGLDGSVAPLSNRPLEPLIAEYTATFGSTWRPVTRRKAPLR